MDADAGFTLLTAMESPSAAIRVRSEREAMDLSLVLASQGIDHVIEPPDDERGWRVSLESKLGVGTRATIKFPNPQPL